MLKLVEISNQRNQKINKIEKIKSNRTVDEAKKNRAEVFSELLVDMNSF